MMGSTFLVTHVFVPTLRFPFLRGLGFAHRAFAAFRAIFCRSSADNFFILALTDLRPSAEKYFRRLFEITQSFYHAQRLRITEYRFIPRCSVFVSDL